MGVAWADAPVLSLSKTYPPYQLDAVRDEAIVIAKTSMANGLNPRSPMTFTNLGSGDVYYALFSNISY